MWGMIMLMEKKMKKIIICCVTFLSVVFSSGAVPSIDLTFATTKGVFKDNSDFTSANYCGIGLTYLLVWSADSTWTAPVQGSIPTTKGSSFGDDYVLFQGQGNKSYGVVGDMDNPNIYTSADVGTGDILNGYCYLMLFNTTSTSPLAGTQYVVGQMTHPMSDNSASQTPPADAVNLALTTQAYFGQANGGTVAAVPEPSTIGLLLVGAGLVAFRRMRRS
jgi:hypothetical protein